MVPTWWTTWAVPAAIRGTLCWSAIKPQRMKMERRSSHMTVSHSSSAPPDRFLPTIVAKKKTWKNLQIIIHLTDKYSIMIVSTLGLFSRFCLDLIVTFLGQSCPQYHCMNCGKSLRNFNFLFQHATVYKEMFPQFGVEVLTNSCSQDPKSYRKPLKKDIIAAY